MVDLGMRKKYPYVSLDDTIKQMGVQIEESVDFADTFIPESTDPAYIFHCLKSNVTYKHDPVGIELLQSMPSLFNDNYWGIPGAGDCDCFTIASVACAIARDIPVRLVLVGNSPDAPSHVYCQMKDRGKWVDFDLVAPMYGITKPYKYKHFVNVVY